MLELIDVIFEFIERNVHSLYFNMFIHFLLDLFLMSVDL